jgi:hypothetical protein
VASASNSVKIEELKGLDLEMGMGSSKIISELRMIEQEFGTGYSPGERKIVFMLRSGHLKSKFPAS